MNQCRVVFSPSGRRGSFDAETTVLWAAQQLGVDLDSICGGRAACGRCQVEITSGEVSPVARAETRYGERRGALAPGRRLACQARLLGDATIEVPVDSQVHRPVVRKSPDERPVEVDPLVTLHAVQVAEPDMQDPSGDARRLLEALQQQWRLTGLSLPLAVLRGLSHTLRAGGWMVTAAVRRGGRIVAVYPGVKTSVAGLAVDIGSTTLAVHLCDLGTGAVLASAGVMNPQIRFGEDVMSRVAHVMMHPGGEVELARSVREALDTAVGQVAGEAGLERSEIVEAVVVGNPVMHHLFLGLDPTGLGGAPFALTVDDAIDLSAAELDLALAPGAMVHVLPCIGGQVGADMAAVVLAEAPHQAEALTMVVDIGTNAEIVLGNRTRLLACSSPTGPAFEGAQVSAGQRAAPGAIERLRIDPQTLEPRYKVIGSDRWSDETGFPFTVTGICGSGIVEAIAEMFLAGILTADGRIDGTLAGRNPRIREEHRTYSYIIRDGLPRIAITQHDVRAIQLAKAALHAGARLLLDRWGAAGPARIKLAGAFGSHIDPLHAMVLGLVPDCPLDQVSAVGNAAGHGARIALVSAAARADIATVVRRIEKVETALEPNFQAHFVAAMALPHASDPMPHLAARVTLPQRAAAAPRSRRRR